MQNSKPQGTEITRFFFTRKTFLDALIQVPMGKAGAPFFGIALQRPMMINSPAQ
jgi:hypothetical protein